MTGARRVLAVVAHPDDESFGLGALIASVVAHGTAVDVLCFTRGEASTLGPADDLGHVRARELALASAALGVRSIELLDYPDGSLHDVPRPELVAHITRLLDREPTTLLVFERDGVTGHPDHRAATAAAFEAATRHDLPVVEWGVPPDVAHALRAELGAPFVALDDDRPGVRDVVVGRGRQLDAIGCHTSQSAGNRVVRRRLALQADGERLRVTATRGA
jgi:LmbE family N-acetylglucosaminyl deacetylase